MDTKQTLYLYVYRQGKRNTQIADHVWSKDFSEEERQKEMDKEKELVKY